MIAMDFDEANTSYGPPPDLADCQCRTIAAFQGRVQGGSMDGETMVVVAWQPTDDERAALAAGGLVFLTMMGGLAPHFLTTSFEEATRVA